MRVDAIELFRKYLATTAALVRGNAGLGWVERLDRRDNAEWLRRAKSYLRRGDA